MAATKFGLPWHLSVTLLSGEELKKSFMGRFGVQLVPCWLPTTWYDCVLRPADGTYGPLGHVFFTTLKLEQHRELWHYDTDGNRVITYSALGRYPQRWTPTATER